MKEQLEEIRRRAMAELGDDADEAQIDAVRVRVLGRSGELTEIMRGMREVPERRAPRYRPAHQSDQARSRSAHRGAH